MVSWRVMVAISNQKDSRPPSGQKHAVKSLLGKRKVEQSDELNILLSYPERRYEALGRPGRHDRHDGQDHKHAAPQVANIKKKKKLN